MNRTLTSKILLRRDSTDNWISSDAILSVGEIGIDTTLQTLRVGNGTDVFSSLPSLVTDAQLIDLIPAVSAESDGLMSVSDKAKLDSIKVTPEIINISITDSSRRLNVTAISKSPYNYVINYTVNPSANISYTLSYSGRSSLGDYIYSSPGHTVYVSANSGSWRYNEWSYASNSVATTTSAGLMSADDKNKLDNVVVTVNGSQVLSGNPIFTGYPQFSNKPKIGATEVATVLDLQSKVSSSDDITWTGDNVFEGEVDFSSAHVTGLKTKITRANLMAMTANYASDYGKLIQLVYLGTDSYVMQAVQNIGLFSIMNKSVTTKHVGYTEASQSALMGNNYRLYIDATSAYITTAQWDFDIANDVTNTNQITTNITDETFDIFIIN